ncbi:MAG: hypothetical protein ABJM43_20770 [Paracoccaceae bacterium]
MENVDLAEYRSRFASCELVMLVDISTLTVLGSDSAIKTGQEHLDALCATAKGIFDLAQDEQIRTAVLSKPTGRQVFVRAGFAVSEVICGIFEPRADISEAIIDAQKMLSATNSVSLGV